MHCFLGVWLLCRRRCIAGCLLCVGVNSYERSLAGLAVGLEACSLCLLLLWCLLPLQCLQALGASCPVSAGPDRPSCTGWGLYVC